jgi:tetratricopeptide (TPR) repeat protein
MAALLPALGLIDNFIFSFSLVFDHLQYLASMGPLALAGAGLARFSDIVIPKRPLLQSGLCAGLLLFLGMASWQRTGVYESQETLWTDTLAKNPNCWVGQYNLGIVFLQKGQVDKALEDFQNAVEINPNYLEAHSNLGLALLQEGQMDEAVAHFKKASEIAPNSLTTHYNLGVALFKNGELDEAVAQYRKALEINPNSLETHYNLGLILFKKSQLDEAITQFLEVLRLKPGFSPAQDYLARAQALVRQRSFSP